MVDRIPRMPRSPAVVTDIPAPLDSGAAALAQGYARMFSGLSGRLNDTLDQAAAIEGARAGAAAGLADDFRPTRDPSIRARAFDRAGIMTYQSQLEIQIRDDMGVAFREHGHDPDGLRKTLAGIKSGYEGAVFDEVRTDFEALFANARWDLMGRALDASEARMLASASAGLQEQIDARLTAIDRMASRAGFDPAMDEKLGQEIAALEGLLLSNAPRGAFAWRGQDIDADGERTGLYGPEAIGQIMAEAETRAKTARILGHFEVLETVESKAAFLEHFVKDWQDGTDGGKYDADRTTGMTRAQYEAARSRMATALARGQAAAKIDTGALRAEIKDAKRLIALGHDPGDEILRELAFRAQAAGDPNLVEDLAREKALLDFSREFRVLVPDQMDAAIVGAREALEADKAPDLMAAERMARAEEIRAEAAAQLKKDPIGWAMRIGIADAPPIDITDPAAIAERRKLAHGLADRFFMPTPRFLRPDEAAQIGAAIDQADKSGWLALARQMHEGFGEDLPEILDELDQADPLFVHAGGLMLAGARSATIEDLAHGREMIRAGAAKPRLVTEDKADLRGLIDEAFAADPAAAMHVSSAAEAILMARLGRTGDLGMAADKGIAERVIQEAAGAVYVGKKRFGGIGEFRGRMIALPPGLLAGDAPAWFSGDTIEELIEDLTAEDWAADGAQPRDIHGRFFEPADLAEDAALVSIGDGRYLVATGDPGGLEPEYVMHGEGVPFVLDIAAIKDRLVKRHPDWWLEGAR